jgi:hypothetical protein
VQKDTHLVLELFLPRLDDSALMTGLLVPVTDHSSWISTDDRISGNIFGDYRPCAQYRVAPYFSPGKDYYPGPDPHVVLYTDGLMCGIPQALDGAIRIFEAVVLADKQHIRTHHYIVSNTCPFYDASYPKTGVVSNFNVPPRPKISTVLYVYIFSTLAEHPTRYPAAQFSYPKCIWLK